MPLEWQKMIYLGAYTIKEMYSKGATSGKDSQPSKLVATSGRK